ncbi:MAG TPA: hypothetical protein VNM37_12765 [Candidatus Dormibacteraeota bacterium]|nr:hypothetical protein [Candidatus Dormibacteraeota bacterium]
MAHTLLATLFKDRVYTGPFASRWIDTAGSYAIKIHLANDGSGAAAGAWTIEESNDASIAHELKATDGESTASTAKVVDISAVTSRVTIDGTGLTVTNGASTMITIVNPARFVRLKLTGAGAVGAKLQGWVKGQD